MATDVFTVQQNFKQFHSLLKHFPNLLKRSKASHPTLNLTTDYGRFLQAGLKKKIRDLGHPNASRSRLIRLKAFLLEAGPDVPDATKRTYNQMARKINKDTLTDDELGTFEQSNTIQSLLKKLLCSKLDQVLSSSRKSSSSSSG